MTPISCDRSASLLSDYLAGETGPEEAQALEAHLETCEACRDLARDLVWQDLDLAGMAAESRVPEMIERLRRELAKSTLARRRAHWRLLGRLRGGPGFLVPVLAAAGLFAAVVLTVAVWNRPASKDRGSAGAPPTRILGDGEFAAARRPGLEEECRRAGEAVRRIREEEERIEEARRRAAGERREEDRLRAEAELLRIEVERRRAERELRRLEEEAARGTATPAPLPVPPPERSPIPSSSPTRTVLARLGKATGEILLIGPEGRSPARAGRDLLSGQGLEARGPATVEFPDGTRLDLEGGTLLRDLEDRSGKSLLVERGILRAEVVRQPPGRPMTFRTPHGRATVLGTRLQIEVDSVRTRLEVTEGKVRLENLSGKAVDVPAGHFAVAAAGVEPAARPLPRTLFVEDFEDPRSVFARWMPLGRGGFPVTVQGCLEVDLSPRPSDPYPDTWHEGGGLVTRGAVRVPFRLSVEVEVSHRHSNVIAALLFLPRPARPSREEGAGLFWVCFREDGISVARGNDAATPVVRTPGGWPRRDRWTAEVEAGEIRVLVNDRETVRYVHGRRDPAWFLALDANAKRDVPTGARVRFDNLRVDELVR